MLIGFSRGAFTVRGLAAFIQRVGLLTRLGLNHLRDIYDSWREWLESANEEEKFEQRRHELQRKVDQLHEHGLLRKNIKIKACAVWDTVASLGLPLPNIFPLRATIDKVASLSEAFPENIENAYHALALHERRRSFTPVLWTSSYRYLKQCWFSGSHAEVGGGLEKCQFADISLAWMISQLHGFVDFDLHALSKVNEERGNPSAHGDTQQPVTSWFWWLTWLTGTIDRTPDEHHTIHFSVRKYREALKGGKDDSVMQFWPYEDIREEAPNEFEMARLKDIKWLLK